MCRRIKCVKGNNFEWLHERRTWKRKSKEKYVLNVFC